MGKTAKQKAMKHWETLKQVYIPTNVCLWNEKMKDWYRVTVFNAVGLMQV